MKLAIKAQRSPGLESLGDHIKNNNPDPKTIVPGIMKPGQRQAAAPVPAIPAATPSASTTAAVIPGAPAPTPAPAAAPALPPDPRDQPAKLQGSPFIAPAIAKPEGEPAPAAAPAPTPVAGEPTPSAHQYEIHTLLGLDGPNEKFSTPEQVQEVFKRGQNAESVSNELAQTKTLLETAQNQLNTKLNPYASDSVAEFNHFVKEAKVDNYGFFNTLKTANLDEMSPMDVILLQRQMQSQDGQFNRENARKYLEQNNGLVKREYVGKTDDDNYDSLKAEHDRQEQSRVDVNQEGLQFDANKARAELKEMKGHIKPMDLKAEQDRLDTEAATRNDTLSKEWGPHVDRSVEQLRKLSLEYPGQNNTTIKLGEFELPTEAIDGMKRDALSMVLGQGQDATPENIKQAEQTISNVAFLDYKDQIFEKIAKNARAMSEEEFELMYSNPSGATIPHPNAAPAVKPGQVKPQTVEERQKENFEKHKKLLAGESGQ